MTLHPLPGTTSTFWANRTQRLRDYYVHDWGHPKYDDTEMFEYLTLEIFSAGLNWELALKRREVFREAFAQYNLAAIVAMGELEVASLLSNPKMVRNRQKIQAIIANARAVMALTPEFSGLSEYVWSFTSGERLINRPSSPDEIPTQSDLSKNMARAMKKRGFQFVGPTIVYNYLQACGVIDDHLVVTPAASEEGSGISHAAETSYRNLTSGERIADVGDFGSRE